MKYEFQVRNELLPGLDSPDLEDEEINMFLNSAQIKVVEKLYAKGLTQLLTELYVPFTPPIEGSNYTGGINNAMSWTVDTLSYMFLVNGGVLVNKAPKGESVPVGTERLKCTVIDKKDALDFAETSKNKVWFEYPKIFIDNAKAVVIVDSFTTIPAVPEQLRLSFIKKPSLIDVSTVTGPTNCELKKVLHIDIVEEAVRQVTSTYGLTQNAEGTEK